MMIDRYRRWFEYEQDSHSKTLDSLNSVAPELRDSQGFRKAIYLVGHIVAARRMWLFRFGVVKDNAELFPKETSLDELPAQIAEMERLWSQYLSKLNDAELERVFRGQEGDDVAPPHVGPEIDDQMTKGVLLPRADGAVGQEHAYDGTRFRNTIEDIVTQLFGHSWYHRGQIAMLLRSIGAEPAVTDLVFWAREPVDKT